MSAQTANEANYRNGYDYSLACELADFEAEQAAEADDEAERQRVNAKMFDYFYS